MIKVPYYVLCFLLDVVFEGRFVPGRFFLLETVARMPYFSYISMLHFYETLGLWRRSADVKRVHFAEEWNEFHHLLIMESLGGDQQYWVRFLAQHSAIVYYFVLIFLWTLSPSLSYKFSELLETHAVDTYGQFMDENEQLLKELPPSVVAVEYYSLGISDTMFQEYQTSSIASGANFQKPGLKMKSLYDVFRAIQNDENEHVSTMKACLDPSVSVTTPSLERRALTAAALTATVGYIFGTGYISDFSGLSTSISDLGDIDTSVETMKEIDKIFEGGPLFDGILAGLASLVQGLNSEETTLLDESQIIDIDLKLLLKSTRDFFITLLELIGLL